MDITLFDVLLFFCTFLIALYYYGKMKMNHFDGKSLKYEKPSVPFFGSTLPILLRKHHFIEFLVEKYNLYPNEKYIGLYEASRPLILLRDVELIKKLAVKEFDHFPNHRAIISADMDALFGNSLLSLQGDKWRDMRATLSPAFTGAKMKNMFVFIEDCAKNVAEHFVKISNDTGKNIIDIEAKDTFTRYTNDVIANSAFGFKVDSLKDTENEFYTVTKEATSFNGRQFLKFGLFAIFPKLMKMLNISFISARATQFYRGLVGNTMKLREEHSIIRNDMIHLLMEAKKGSLKHEKHADTNDAGFATVEESTLGKREVTQKWSDDDLVAQALIFLIGGFETSATCITFLIYELVRNPEVQRRLQQEVDDYLREHGSNISYNDLPKLKYLDCCVSESLRMWPPGVATDRICVKPYQIPPHNDESTETYQINVGESIWIPIYPLHHDPKCYPNPEKFNPDRFSDENKSSLELGAYLPFGVGPRNCIGSRYALMVVKLIIFHILAKFDFVATSKTQIPLKLDKATVNLLAEDGVHVGLKRRNV